MGLSCDLLCPTQCDHGGGRNKFGGGGALLTSPAGPRELLAKHHPPFHPHHPGAGMGPACNAVVAARRSPPYALRGGVRGSISDMAGPVVGSLLSRLTRS
jgi:hypothetical protein